MIRRKTKNLLKNLGLSISVCLFLFIIFEISIRAFYPISDSIMIGDEIIGHKHIPNYSGTYLSPGDSKRPINVKFNNEGFRDVNHEIENKQNKYRVAFLGDSFVDALDTDVNDTFIRQVTTMLEETHSEKYETFNFGMYYFSTAQEYLTYGEYVKKYNPDMVYLFIFFNDIYETCSEDIKNPTYYIQGGQVIARTFHPNEYGQFKLFISKYSKSLVFLRQIYYKVKDNNSPLKNDKDFKRMKIMKIYLKEYGPEQEECWELFKYFISKLKKEIGNETKFEVVIIPDPYAIYEEDQRAILNDLGFNESVFDFNKPERIFEEILKKEEINYINLRPYIDKLPERPYYLVDKHFNNQGHKLIANIIYEQLNKTYTEK